MFWQFLPHLPSPDPLSSLPHYIDTPDTAEREREGGGREGEGGRGRERVRTRIEIVTKLTIECPPKDGQLYM